MKKEKIESEFNCLEKDFAIAKKKLEENDANGLDSFVFYLRTHADNIAKELPDLTTLESS